MSKEQLDLLHEVGKRAGSTPRLTQLVKQITKMTQQTLKGSASSVLVLDDEHEELSFIYAAGEAGKMLKQTRIDAESGIAGWVACHGKPLIVNNVYNDPRFDGSVDKTTGFVTRSIICAPLMVRGHTIGSIEVLNKEDGTDFNEQDLDALMAVASTVAMAIENTRLHQLVLAAYKGTINALAGAIDAKDHYTLGHSQRVMDYAMLGGSEMSQSPQEMEVLEFGAILHDIGKIGIPDGILLKAGQLTDEEWAIMTKHSEIGARMMETVPFLNRSRELVLHHHERYDGKGYPAGLSGQDIPIGSRLIAVADAFDTMTTDRSYRAAMSTSDGVDELSRCSGTQFCPVAVEAFVAGLEKRQGESSRDCYA